jgi:C4-type Zn-finger protein
MLTKKCLYCGGKFEADDRHYYKKYCSRKCKDKFNYKYIKVKNPWKKKPRKIEFICQNCGYKNTLMIKKTFPSEKELDSIMCHKCKKSARG